MYMDDGGIVFFLAESVDDVTSLFILLRLLLPRLYVAAIPKLPSLF